MDYKKQHWVPQSYLQAWYDPDVPTGQDNFVWVYTSEGNSFKRKAPKNIFFEPEMYTIHLEDGSRVLDIEHGLAGLEDAFANVRKNSILKRKGLTRVEKLIVLAFMAASFSRTRLNREHLKRQWGSSLELMEYMKREFEMASPEQRKVMSSIGPLSKDSEKLTIDEVKRLAISPLQETLMTSIAVQVELFMPMHLSFLCTKNDPGFITSDAPCVWFDPDAYKRPAMYRSPGLMYPKIEITLPISPKEIAFLTWTKLDNYINITDNILDNFNRRTRFYAEEHFVVSRNITKDIWFDAGKPPAD